MQNGDLIQGYLNSQIKVVSDLKEKTDVVEKILDVILEARDHEKRIYVMGNGGSASTATHFVSDLLKTSITKDEKRFKSISATVYNLLNHTSIMDTFFPVTKTDFAIPKAKTLS